MANIYNSVGGRKLSKVIALNEGVQAELEARTFEIAVRAEEILQQHRADGHSEILIEEGKVDKYVILSDDRGQRAAMSIEYGRKASVVVRKDKHGNEFLDVVPEMDGLYVLATASNLPKKRKGKVKVD
ncbi:hypothetical protein GCM10010211_48860 [Streptomyces albospinus]|uniref:Uncharacterized protein n=2 Tax=Streptomyces TaxID=1883 RepID=A0A117Q4K6_9ACTN|nr:MULTISPECIES: DUF5403 family protein [Streptomyces]KUN08593.1 hypothetical protein AQI95_09570 [Streptomyces yokosukanensis]GGU77175.1 hypothetical protein GCM10010211_48860 [Streptomyces albospinus]